MGRPRIATDSLAAGMAAVALLGTCLLVAACGDNRAPRVMCTVEAPSVCPDPAPRYADVETILGRRCVSCHYGMPQGPWPLNDYQSLVDWEDLIRTDLLNCTMPPADSGIVMTTEERTAILTWFLCGHPE